MLWIGSGRFDGRVRCRTFPLAQADGPVMASGTSQCQRAAASADRELEAARRVRLGRYPMLASNESLTRIY